ncbi:hypothetical protein [Fusobacterium sp. PH5-44]|uniref:hypothetical protein n=1 Tax=unclassified Fusobacterium TaxID=2648384 RepID=UPI003D219559
MNKKERIKAAIEGSSVDKIPYSFWSHFPKEDLDPVKLAKKTYDFYKEYDIDFVKTMNNGMYSVEDFGCVVDFSQIENGGVAAPAAMPDEYVTKIENAIKKALEDPEFIEKAKAQNLPLNYLDSKNFTQIIREIEENLKSETAKGEW